MEEMPKTLFTQDEPQAAETMREATNLLDLPGGGDDHQMVTSSNLIDESAAEIEHPSPPINLRRELWQIVCNIDDLKH